MVSTPRLQSLPSCSTEWWRAASSSHLGSERRRSNGGWARIAFTGCTVVSTRLAIGCFRSKVAGWERCWPAGRALCSHHRSAAAHWGIRGPSSRAIEVTAPRRSRSRESVHRHFGVLPSDEVTAREEIPVTTVPRTIFDLAAIERPEAVEGALRQAEYLRLYDRLSLRDLLDRYPGRRGTRAVRLVLARLAESAGQIDSRLEERFLPFLTGTACRGPSSMPGSRWEGRGTGSTASGLLNARSSSSTGGRDTAPASRSATTATATAASAWPAMASPASSGLSWTTNQMRSPPTCARCSIYEGASVGAPGSTVPYTNVRDNVRNRERNR